MIRQYRPELHGGTWADAMDQDPNALVVR